MAEKGASFYQQFRDKKEPTVKDLAVMCRQMATMVSAGLTVLKTIRILAIQTENKKLALILDKVAPTSRPA
jgi:type II secretory pathway component PulF